MADEAAHPVEARPLVQPAANQARLRSPLGAEHGQPSDPHRPGPELTKRLGSGETPRGPPAPRAPVSADRSCGALLISSLASPPIFAEKYHNPQISAEPLSARIAPALRALASALIDPAPDRANACGPPPRRTLAPEPPGPLFLCTRGGVPATCHVPVMEGYGHVTSWAWL
ncbi:hypothetical protein BGZ61DRAFT_519743 [Ilyonectria robusta]|uniref:uncharacterized protein n=1 Tax=Ilyonectria robusta TaxID=1079257 RepID=UPI001E8ECCDF|nr:uncharacterized protein BGZ61DRAFT_519743 [Ilyonectria robusta]KAH8684163.1 hypothetical protein BGZ61DRAFT_519743 [Ilyonectria robusta]